MSFIWSKADQLGNWTYSIDLSSSWDRHSVQLKPIYKHSPVLNQFALWPDSTGNTFYSFDGSIPAVFEDWSDLAPKSTQFWYFTPNGGSGDWMPASIISSSIFSSLIQVSAGYYASGNGLGFALGGIASDGSSYPFGLLTDTWQRLPGIVMYNESSQEWSNATSRGFTYNGFADNGAAHFVPNFGPEGLLFAFGGNTANSADGDAIPISLNTAAMFEPVSKQWKTQPVTGDPPDSTLNQCVVGVQGDNGTYEIFMYGGYVDDDTTATMDLGAVWVLSLPAFHWTKQLDPLGFGRFRHSCQVAGNRQMISIGGQIVTKDVDTIDWFDCAVDPWEQGIGVFDLTDLKWKSSYDADAESYVTSRIIKDYYEQNAPYPSWDSPEVERWMVEQGALFNQQAALYLY